MHTEVLSIIRYLVAGGLAAGAHFFVLVSLVEFANVNPNAASTIGFLIAIAVNYPLQYRWAFFATGKHSIVFKRYIIVTLGGLLVNVTSFFILYSIFGFRYIISQVASTAAVTSINYIINSRYTFRN